MRPTNLYNLPQSVPLSFIKPYQEYPFCTGRTRCHPRMTGNYPANIQVRKRLLLYRSRGNPHRHRTRNSAGQTARSTGSLVSHSDDSNSMSGGVCQDRPVEARVGTRGRWISALTDSLQIAGAGVKRYRTKSNSKAGPFTLKVEHRGCFET